MTQKKFPTPEDAEAAFYEAFERADLEAMMAVWADEDEIVCIHPNGPRLTGLDAVRESWARIFRGGPRLRFRVAEQHCIRGMLLAIHVVHEHIRPVGQADELQPIIATNVYLLTDGSWRMILHHASPSPEAQPARSIPVKDEEDETPRVLH